MLGEGLRASSRQDILKSRGSEMVLSTFSMRSVFLWNNSTWIKCKMTGTSSAYSMYLIIKLYLNKNIFSLEKWGGGGGSSAVPRDIDNKQ